MFICKKVNTPKPGKNNLKISHNSKSVNLNSG